MTDDILLIPGPVVLSEKVTAALVAPFSVPDYFQTYKSALLRTRKVFRAGSQGLPLILAGSGTLGWEVAASNLLAPGERALVVSTGYFGDHLAECLAIYGAEVKKLDAPLGDVVPLETIRQSLLAKKTAMITLTQVDTSTGVLTDVGAIASLVHKVSPETLIIVDGVCSLGCEDFRFQEWKIDYALTGSQKALGAPPGLSVSMVSDRALEKALNRPSEATYYTSLKRWAPVMRLYEQGKGAYFATPAVQLLDALNAALGEILDEGLDVHVAKHKKASDWLKNELQTRFKLKMVPVRPEVAAHGLTVAYYDTPADLIAEMKKLHIVITGGIHKDLKSKTIRIGHMGVSACEPSKRHLQLCVDALAKSLQLCTE
ncbi:LAMI_0G16820g1_1 [Lachancea mirantina]|uniref:alanine--glyoxylate transaminase n=1 Tax=Lachancea mirantina TaxID=1230905 RepID=A0A1G4KCR6_9SACH|nr:LAMI_0G16820g1_1 [Lachancea mirantina]